MLTDKEWSQVTGNPLPNSGQRLLPPQKTTAGVADDFEAMAADPDIQRELKDTDAQMLSHSANLLVRAYIRFRHNGIGSEDQAVVDAIAQYIGAYFDKPVANMTNDELNSHFIDGAVFKV